MRKFLIFSVTGPFAAYSAGRGKRVRASGSYMSRSNVLGLIGAAIGIERTDLYQHEQLAQNYGVAILERQGGSHELTDYQTAQSTPANRQAYTRAEALRTAGNRLRTSITHREYRTDVDFDVAVWQTPDSNGVWELVELAEALRSPKFILYIGRKSCPLAAPLHPVIVSANDAKEALLQSVESIEVFPRYYTQEVKGTTRHLPARLISDKDGMPHDVNDVYEDWQYEPANREYGSFVPRPCLILHSLETDRA